eukprot:Phypoly_transcript_10770.p1 GENE.Phypoly_transcript_10770~~Phypoly_transcript_10770.p1  ORF type:complete len:407 (-),score=86.14 Phypoly_transcript_10770:16-1236(-)
MANENRKKKRKVVKCTIDINEIPTDSTLEPCPLCGDANTSRYAIQFSKLFLSCPTCQLVFLHPRHHLTEDEEKKRYEEHNNSPYDQRYRSFLAPVLDELMPLLGDNYNLHGLDYGCGPGPTLSTMFREKGFKMADYDPFFKPVPFVDDLQTGKEQQSYSNNTNSTNTPTTSTTNPTNLANSTNSTTNSTNSENSTNSTNSENSTNSANGSTNPTNNSANSSNDATNPTTDSNNTDTANTQTSTPSLTEQTKDTHHETKEANKTDSKNSENTQKNTQNTQNTKKTNAKLIPPYDKDPFNPLEDHFIPPFDFITCTETAEHFRYPAEDFKKLLSPLLLHPNKGILAIMTQMLYSKEQFVNWWYLRDKTHVSFYTVPTMEYIARANNLQLILPATKNIAIFVRKDASSK